MRLLQSESPLLSPPLRFRLRSTARNDAVYKNTLFNRDDQIFDTLAAGINAGQHEGGGKSVKVRRFGINLDLGGVNGGLKVLVDDIQQNQSLTFRIE